MRAAILRSELLTLRRIGERSSSRPRGSRDGRIGRSMARRGFMDLLVIPWVDKTIAIVACLPFAVELYRRWAVGHVNFPRAVLGLQLLIIIVMMVVRTAPVRVTPNPWFWLLAFVTTYATLGFSAFAGQGVSLTALMRCQDKCFTIRNKLPHSARGREPLGKQHNAQHGRKSTYLFQGIFTVNRKQYRFQPQAG